MINRVELNSQIKFKTSTLRSNLCDCSDAHILLSETVTVPNIARARAAANNKKI